MGLFILTSCGIKLSSSDSKKPERSIDPLEEYHKRPLPITQFESVSFIRKKQQTVRYDCDGVVTSNGLETINSLDKKLTVDYENRKGAWSFEAYNRRTRNGKLGFLVKIGQFVIDYSPTVFHMTVNEGLNDVEYVFYKCTNIIVDAQNNQKCAEGALQVEKEGIVQIDVLYSQEIVPGERIIRPSPESCKPNP